MVKQGFGLTFFGTYAGFILTSVQLTLDVVLSARTLLIAQSFLELLSHGAFFGHSLLNGQGIGTQIALKPMTLKDFMDTRYAKSLVSFEKDSSMLCSGFKINKLKDLSNMNLFNKPHRCCLWNNLVLQVMC